VFALEESDDYGSGKLNEMWQEGTETGVEGDSTEISYSNAPANINSGGGIYDSISNSGGGVDNNLTRFLGTFQLRSRTREVINFRSDELTQFLNEDTNGLVTLIITRVEASSNVIAFNPKENSTFSIPSLHLTLEQEDQFTCEGENVVFPADGNVVNVTQAPYFAIPDDGIDDTQAIQQALDDHPNGNFIIYLPNGVYNISNRLKWPLSGFGPNDFQYVVMQGQCTEGTILQLDDSAPGYQDPNARRPVVLTSDSFAEGATQGGNTRFRNSVRNLTIHTGTGNPGAVGLQFKANNTGTARDLKIISGDGLGVVGLELSHINDNGPLLVKNVEINGFDYGIRNNFNGLSQTFENITLRDQNVYGFFNFQQAIAVRGLVSFNEVPAFFQRDQGSYSVLVDSELNGTGDAINNSAIIFSDGFFVRNVQTSGYKVAVTERVFGTTPVTRVEGPYVEEYSSSDPLRACLNIEKSLNLSVQDEPEIPRGDIATDWVNIESFGATIDRNRGDDTQAIQAALNSGASIMNRPSPPSRPSRPIILRTVDGTITSPFIVKLSGKIPGVGT
ncbi:MAG: glycosyl hydrolase family 28-related protein, partial [Bacteroidota bacterium]